ncbi:MAG TPA: SusC/RagA family TonB-linked outer membrane protein, partial [Flavitalea sp.]|nr:SusC/RagA family TonB-linked outer membrane protein [Flavitalea sp.]
MRKLLFIAMAILLLYSLELSAQSSRTVTGKVTDDKGDPVFGASILIKGSRTGTTTDANGEFRLNVPASAKALVISAINHLSTEMPIGQNDSYTINLKDDTKNLEEVVVTGYGRERKGRFVGAASVLSAKVVETVPVGAFDQALQGRAPGLLINSNSGQPGTSANINIRGIHSITGAFAQPLFVVDGIPLAAQDMQTINPNDFESITILKDASAAALYGARGGLGVIVITTKKGKAGTSNFTFRTQFGFTEPPNWNKFDMMNTSEILQYEERLKLASTPGWDYSKNNPVYATLTDAQKARNDFLLDSIGKINTDYKDHLFRQGMSQLYEINASGGTDKTRFFLSAGVFDQEGTDLSSRLRRFTGRFNIDHTANKLSIQFNTLAGYSITNYSEGELLGNSARNSFQMAWRAKPYENPYRPDGSIIYGTNTTLALKQIGNVLEGMENSVWQQNQIKINSGLTLAYKLLPTLTIRNTLGIDVSDDRWQRFIKANSYIGSLQSFGGSGINSEAHEINAQLINTLSTVYSNSFDRHELEVGAYFEVIRGYNKGLGFTLYNLDPRLDQTGQGAGTIAVGPGQTTYPQNASSAKSGYGIRSYFGNARYTLDNKYTINANIRRDGTSRIANETNKEITTWSAGIVWNAFLENFMQNQNFITDLKARASYGAVPNIGSISTSTYNVGQAPGTTFATVTNYLGPQVVSFSSSSQFQYAGSPVTGQGPNTAGNPELKIETIKKANIGVDIGMWTNRARVTLDVYKDKTEDLFVNLALPGTSGYGVGFLTPVNAGVMTNQGLEVSVAVDIVKTKQVDWTVGLNHAINKNEIEDLGPVNEIPTGTFIIREGLPYGSHYAQHYLGADPATGKPRFETKDGKETLDPGAADLFAKYGTFLPKHVGGIYTDFRFGRITLSALFSYQFDVSRYNNIENWITRGIAGFHSSVNASKRLLTQQWQKAGDVAYYQAPAYDRGFNSSDIQDAKFLRFRHLNVAYNIPEINV